MIKRKIRVLIVDDSLFFRQALRLKLSLETAFEVIGESPDAMDAAEKIEALNPDVITLDVEMPGMNGIEFLRKVMPKYAIPVVVVSSVNGVVFDALSAGAVDFVAKPDNRGSGFDMFINELKVKIKVASTANRSMLKAMAEPSEEEKVKLASKLPGVIAIGASTGGTEAIFEVMKDLPRQLPGIVIVQHMPAIFTRMYAERLNNTCMLEVKEAENGDRLYPGRALVAPGEFQMRLRKNQDGYFVECKREEKVSGHSPSVDVLFRSVAESAGKDAVGIILTGMGADGAKGLLEMRNKGAMTFGQDEATSVVYGMPRVAFELGGVARQLPLDSISRELLSYLKLQGKE